MTTVVSGCGRSKKPIVVGSKEGTEQTVVGEIVAQHLERRLGRKIVRNLNLGNTATTYQSLINGEIGIYPEDTGTMQALIMKEPPSPDPETTLERVRNEMRRISQTEVLEPLGIDNAWAIVVKTKLETLSEAAAVDARNGWRLGVTRDFNQRKDGLSMLNEYHLPMAAMTFVGDTSSLYASLLSGKLTMIAGNITDAELGHFPGLYVLRDDKKVFGSYQTCLLARVDLLASDPKIQPALAELSGKITTATMRRLNAEVIVDHKKPAEAATEFLSQAGLK
jgi:glycine betaine/choline ABC-type transport system substrate-binding protein